MQTKNSDITQSTQQYGPPTRRHTAVFKEKYGAKIDTLGVKKECGDFEECKTDVNCQQQCGEEWTCFGTPDRMRRCWSPGDRRHFEERVLIEIKELARKEGVNYRRTSKEKLRYLKLQALRNIADDLNKSMDEEESGTSDEEEESGTSDEEEESGTSDEEEESGTSDEEEESGTSDEEEESTKKTKKKTRKPRKSRKPITGKKKSRKNSGKKPNKRTRKPKEPPSALDPLRLFYTSLFVENPESQMAIDWLTKYSLLVDGELVEPEKMKFGMNGDEI